MVDAELAGARAPLAPRLDELAVRRELDDPRIGLAAVSVAHEDVAIGGDRDVRRGVELVGALARDTRLAEGQQHLALRAELDDLMTLAVGTGVVARPNVAAVIDIEAMGVIEETLAEACHKFSGGIEFLDRVEQGVGAVLHAAAVEHPDALAVGIDVDARYLPDLAALGDLEPILIEPVRIGGAIGSTGVCANDADPSAVVIPKAKMIVLARNIVVSSQVVASFLPLIARFSLPH